MKIGNSMVAMASEHSYSAVKQEKQISMTTLKSDEKEIDSENKDLSLFEQLEQAEKEYEQEQKNNALQNRNKEVSNSYNIMRPTYNRDGLRCVKNLEELKLLLLEQMINAMQKRRMTKDRNCLKSADDIIGQVYKNAAVNTGTLSATSNYYVSQTVKSSFYKEEESASFKSEGCVITEDGRKINFGISFEMSRSFSYSEESYTREEYMLCDPLVFNFTGNTAELTDQKFKFDLNCDGEKEEISRLSSGSGLLAIDKNNDGKINDGSELFGTLSGDGFADLAAYDEDGNGWIDENDSVFDKLKIWTVDENGNDKMIGIAKAGIGAIFLGNTGTKFSLKNPDDNATQGVIQNTGIFLYENGQAGTVQHVDFAV